ncbi:MAG: OsmC family protein [Bacteroidota bacterium]
MEIRFDGNKKVNALIDGFTVKTDQPLQSGGEETAPSPFALFLASLGTCAGIYARGFCDQRGINTEGMWLSMDHEYDPVQKLIAKFMIKIHVPADFPEQYESALIKTASLCKVKRHLNPSIVNEITIIRQ